APRRGFTPREFEIRTARAQQIMRGHELDAIVLTLPPNVRYFTGFDSQFWESPTRPWFIVVPADGAPIAVIPEIGAPEMAKTWLKDIRTWPAPRPADDGTSLLAGILNGVPRRTGRIGFELGREHSLRMPVMQFRELEGELAGIEAVNGSPCIWEIRMVKTEAEIAHIRHICELASDAYAAVPGLVSIGDSEREAARKLRIELARRGADSTPFLPAIAGQGGVPQIVCGPHDRVIGKGDVLFFDTGSTFDGYFCDFDRNYAAGRVASEARRAHEAMWLATEAGIAAAVVGARTDDVFASMARIIAEAGSYGNNVGRLGHGLGMQLTEPPSNMPGDGTVLAANMVITIEPGIEYAPGRMIVHEENIVVRPDGPELLTRRAPRELPEIG
ncbi:MAG: Xaa-Pro peptidase family protein, partial [Pseudomonadota bacterium]|nr:Xaa-Pro peptidase family protein [Pseudomonadota bacterium]